MHLCLFGFSVPTGFLNPESFPDHFSAMSVSNHFQCIGSMLVINVLNPMNVTFPNHRECSENSVPSSYNNACKPLKHKRHKETNHFFLLLAPLLLKLPSPPINLIPLACKRLNK